MFRGQRPNGRHPSSRDTTTHGSFSSATTSIPYEDRSCGIVPASDAFPSFCLHVADLRLASSAAAATSIRFATHHCQVSQLVLRRVNTPSKPGASRLERRFSQFHVVAWMECRRRGRPQPCRYLFLIGSIFPVMVPAVGLPSHEAATLPFFFSSLHQRYHRQSLTCAIATFKTRPQHPPRKLSCRNSD